VCVYVFVFVSVCVYVSRPCLSNGATHCNPLQQTATNCNTRNTLQLIHALQASATQLQHTVTQLQHAATQLQHAATQLQHIPWTCESRLSFSQGASHCNTLHHVATNCNTLQHTTAHCNTTATQLQHQCNTNATNHCNTYREYVCYGSFAPTWNHTATHCNTLQHTATHCIALQHTATHCIALQHTATLYSTLQYTATHCNTLQQNTATHTMNMRVTAQLCLRGNPLIPTATHGRLLQHTTPHCTTLHHTATQLQHNTAKLQHIPFICASQLSFSHRAPLCNTTATQLQHSTAATHTIYMRITAELLPWSNRAHFGNFFAGYISHEHFMIYTVAHLEYQSQQD